ncbi:MAG: hypothetical protein AAFQ82_08240 [Myxococcota bacterium]
MKQIFSIALAGALAMGVGCSDERSTLVAQAPGEVRTSLFTADPSIGGAEIEVLEGDNVVDRRTIEIGLLPMPSGDVMGGDAFFTMNPGLYTVRATALDDTGEPAQNCSVASTPARVNAGTTTEVVLSILCSQEGSGGLDAIVTVSSNPVITNLAFEPNKFNRTCSPTLIRATALDRDGENPTISWSLRNAPVDARFLLEPMSDVVRFTSETIGTYELIVTATDTQGLSSSLSFPVHIGEGAEGPCLRRPRNTDVRFTEVTWRVPEFAGAFIDGDDLVIQLTELNDATQSAAVAAVNDIIGSDRELPENVRFAEAEFDFASLMGARVQARTLMGISGVTSLSVNERSNRVRLGVEDDASRRRAASELRLLGIPAEMVNIEVSPAFRPLQNTVEVRPVVGGTQIQNGNGSCTLGFVGVRAGVRGFVTNSHCTLTQGGVEGTVLSQPGDSGSRIGVEMVDPTYFSGGGCPSGRRCRLSDSAWATLDDGVTSERGRVYRDSLTRYRVVKEYLYPLDGETLRKVGRTTGTTSGEVSETCEDMNVADSDITLLCQARVEAQSAPGDSGSPVMKLLNPLTYPGSHPVAAMGVLWGGRDGTFVFSPVQNVEFGLELGNMNVKFGDDAPTVSITSPVSGSAVPFGGFNSTTLTASTDDLEDGAGCCTVSWSSNVDGSLGTGQSLTTVFPTPGPRTITATAVDSFGNSSTDSVTVVTSNIAPAVTIARPSSGDSLFRGLPYTLQAWAFDSEIFSNLPCGALSWESSNFGDPFPALGCTPISTFLTTGTRTLTVTAVDGNGGIGDRSVTFSVDEAATGVPPIVSILQPTPSSGISPFENTALVATAQDTDDPMATINYTWRVQVGSTTRVIGTDTSLSGGQTQLLWMPSDDVPFNCGGSIVTLSLEASDAEGSTTETVSVVVTYPPC